MHPRSAGSQTTVLAREAALELRGKLVRALVALVAAQADRAKNHSIELRRNFGASMKGWGIGMRHLFDPVRHLIERAAAGEHDIQDHATREDVSPLIDAAAELTLWAHEAR